MKTKRRWEMRPQTLFKKYLCFKVKQAAFMCVQEFQWENRKGALCMASLVMQIQKTAE